MRVFAADKLAQFRDAPLYYGWLNAKTFFNVLAHIPPPEPNPDAPSPMPPFPWNKVLGASGLTGLKSASFSYRESHDGSQLNFYFAVPESERQGIFKMMAAAPKDANPPAFVPADAVKFWRWRVDGQKDWAALEKMLSDISPAWLNSLNAAISMANASAQQKDPSFDFAKISSATSATILSATKRRRRHVPRGFEQRPVHLPVCRGESRPGAAGRQNVSALTCCRRKTRPRRAIFWARKFTPSPCARARPSAPRSLYCAASGGYVALTTDVSMLENYLRSAGSKVKPLRETAGLADAAQHVGGAGSGLFGYENQSEIMRAALTLLKNSATDSPAIGAAVSGPCRLPRREKSSVTGWISRCCRTTTRCPNTFIFLSAGGNVTADGLAFKIFAPRPPQMVK